MLSLLAALAATAAAQAATPTAARDLKDIPGVVIKYYDVTGKTERAIRKSIAQQRPKGADGKPIDASFNWIPDAQITKRTEGNVCTVQSAKVTFSGTADIPRLVDPASVDKEILSSWNGYVAGLERRAALELGFYADRMGQIEAALTGQPCDKAEGAFDAALQRLRAEGQQYVAAQAKAASSKL